MSTHHCLPIILTFIFLSPIFAEPIDREALVKRHNITLTAINANEILQVGNGEIAFGIDPTGLQTFHGNTMSQWGWHSVPCPKELYEGAETPHQAFKNQEHNFYGRPLGYRTEKDGQEALFMWMRENPHRLNLGRLRFLIKKSDGKLIEPADVQNIKQTLDLWTGTIDCRYTIEDTPIHVQVCCEPKTGALVVKIESELMSQERLQIEWSFPYGHHGNSGADWARPDKHKTVFQVVKDGVGVKRQLDSTTYFAAMRWTSSAGEHSENQETHTFTLTPRKQEIAFDVHYFQTENSSGSSPAANDGINSAFIDSANHWQKFWQTGGAVDLSCSKDPRWKELERRIVLSQYLLAVNEAGSLPPQESGLYNNSGWYGKFHLEMYFWHEAHYALWGRLPLLEPSLQYYRTALPKAKELARVQGFKGARYPKMIGPDSEDSPSSIGPFLIWQQPHPIFFAELEYRIHPAKEVLEKWKDVVQESAEFMADFAHWDEKAERYVLGPPLKTVPENTQSKTTFNPTFELSYWRTGLRLANTWRERLGLPREKQWDEVIAKLAPLPQHDGVYLSQERMLDTYTKMNWEHPSLIGPNGMLPIDGAEPAIAKATLEKVWQHWNFDRCWGWDFPMVAMSAAKNGRPDIAVEALLHPSEKNGVNNAGLSTGGPFPYFPSNGGLLYAVAMMCAGWDGAPTQHVPGFPNDGSWNVKFEGLTVAP